MDPPSYDTDLVLTHWRGSQHDSERMCAHLLLMTEYKEVDPSHPLGGPDGTKDAVCIGKGKRWVAAVYFPREPVDFKEVEKKFRDDAKGISKNKAQGIVFFTNQKLSVTERDLLISIAVAQEHETDLFHRERIRLLLDHPQGYGTRFKFLRIPMSESEQASFFEVYNQAVLAKLDDVLRAQNEMLRSAREHTEKLDRISSAMEKLAIAQVNVSAALPEAASAASTLPGGAAPSEGEQEDEDQELVQTYHHGVQTTSNDKVGAS